MLKSLVCTKALSFMPSKAASDLALREGANLRAAMERSAPVGLAFSLVARKPPVLEEPAFLSDVGSHCVKEEGKISQSALYCVLSSVTPTSLCVLADATSWTRWKRYVQVTAKEGVAILRGDLIQTSPILCPSERSLEHPTTGAVPLMHCTCVAGQQYLASFSECCISCSLITFSEAVSNMYIKIMGNKKCGEQEVYV